MSMKKQSVLRGTIYLMAAQAAFVASGYAIHISLGRLLGPSEYGIYAVVISLMTIVNLVLVVSVVSDRLIILVHSDEYAGGIRNLWKIVRYISSEFINCIYGNRICYFG